MCKVSIIIPAYNVATYIHTAIESAVNQTEKNIEIIIIDDGSSDSTYEIIKKYAEGDDRIVAITQQNQGVSKARNEGLNLANGDFVIFLDSDDWLEYDAVEKLLAASNGKNTLICSECYFVEKKNENELMKERQGIGNIDSLKSSDFVLELVGTVNQYKTLSSCYKLFSREIIEENNLRFSQDILMGEDALFTFQYLCNIKFVQYISVPLWNILNRPGSATNGKYNSKWKTALASVDKMMEYTDQISDITRNNLKVLKAERAKWIELKCLRSAELNIEDFKFIRLALRKNFIFLFRKNKNFKELMHIIALCFFPYRILRVIVR